MDKKLVMEKVRGEVLKKFGGDAMISANAEDMGELLLGKIRIWIPTSLPKLDKALGREGSGIPCGKLIELFGPEGHGKSTLGYYLLGIVQQQGGLAFLIDSEGSLDTEWATKQGVNIDELNILPSTPKTSLEMHLDKVTQIAKEIRAMDENIPILFVWDTIYATPVNEALKAKSYSDTKRLLGLPRALSDHLPVFCPFLAQYKVGMIWLNQIRDNVGVTWGDTFSTPGGHALKHFAFVRAMVKRTMKKENGEIETVVANFKNKFGQPFQKAMFKISPKTGIQPILRSEKEEAAAVADLGPESVEEE
jgi:recombination protein RecA